ncbi:MAG: phosphatidate cytidylyltransferase [Pseudomonadota bacterium]
MAGGIAQKFADLGPRLLTALVLGPLALGLLWIGGVATTLLVAALAGVLAQEWRSVTAHAGGALEPRDAFYVAAAVFAVLLGSDGDAEYGLLSLAILLAIAGVTDLVKGRPAAALWGVSGIAVMAAGCVAFQWLRETDPYGPLASFWIVLVVIATDVGGYFAGRLIGGPKLWPAVSPKKTWAGLGGAVVLAMVAGGLFSRWTTGTFVVEVCTVSAAAAILAQLGDLGESAVKRRFGVKDSGRLFPGHGGALDRFDGLIAATLVVAAVTLWRGQTVFIWS